MKKLKIHIKSILEGHSGALYALNQTEEAIYTSGSDIIIAEWPKYNIDEKVALAQIDQPIYQMRIHQNLLYAGQYDGTLVIIDLDKRSILKKLQLHTQSIFDLYIDQAYIITAGGDGTLCIMNHQYEVLKRLEVAKASLRNITANKDYFFVATSEPSLIRLNKTNFQIEQIPHLHEKSIFAISIIENQFLVTGGRDAALIIQNLNTFEVIHKIPAHLSTINDLSYHPNLGLLASASKDKTIKIWDSKTFKLLKVLDLAKYGYHSNSVNKIIWSTDDKSLISVSDDRLGIIWNIEIE